MYPEFGKIGIIFGGLSSEREVSLKSGHAVFDALVKEGLDVAAIDLNTEIPSEVERIIKDASIEVVFIAMHGRFGEDGRLQSILERIGLPYVGSDSFASALAMDKIASRNIFIENNILAPCYKTFNIDRNFNYDEINMDFPLVVKPKSQGSSIGVSFVNNIQELKNAFDLAFQYDNNIIVEQYIKGKELTVGILENQALEPIKIMPKNQFFDFQAKYNKGMTEYILPANISDELRNQVRAISLKAYRLLGCRHFSRIDLILDEKNNPYILEINTIPGFTSTSLVPKAALYQGISFSQLCLKLLNLAIRDTKTLLNT